MDPLRKPWIDGDTLEITYSGVLRSLCASLENQNMTLVVGGMNDHGTAVEFLGRILAYMPGETPVSVVIKVGRDVLLTQGDSNGGNADS